MGQKLSEADLALYRAVDEVLHYVWDPIGVSDAPQARDEYHGYLPQIFSLVRDGSDAQVIARYLGAIAIESMGLNANTNHDLKVARILVDWKDLIHEKNA